MNPELFGPFLEQLRDLTANNELTDVIDRLALFLKGKDKSLIDEMRTHKGRWNAFDKKVRTGAISPQDAEVNLNELRSHLQQFIDVVEKKLNLKLALLPIPTDDVGVVERLVMKELPFQDVRQWLETLGRYGRAVCRIEPQPSPNISGYGTGFLIAPDVVMTNYHVIQSFLKERADQVVLRFGYETDGNSGEVAKGQEYKLAADWRLIDSPNTPNDLDFALIRLAEPAGRETVNGAVRGTIPLPVHPQTPQVERPLLILQHPNAEPLKLAIGTVVAGAAANRVLYTTNTLGGSSGSPCFTLDLELVALHHVGAQSNEAVRMGSILDFLKAHRLGLEAKGLGSLVG